MTQFKFLGAVAILSALVATPALAEHMIDEPGMFAFVHPNKGNDEGPPCWWNKNGKFAACIRGDRNFGVFNRYGSADQGLTSVI